MSIVNSNISLVLCVLLGFYVECIDRDFCLNSDLSQMTVRDALNSALDEEMSADPKVFLMGEEVTSEIHKSQYFMESLFH